MRNERSCYNRLVHIFGNDATITQRIIMKMKEAKVYNRSLLLGVSKKPFPHLLFKGGEKLQISLVDADNLIYSATTAKTDASGNVATIVPSES